MCVISKCIETLFKISFGFSVTISYYAKHKHLQTHVLISISHHQQRWFTGLQLTTQELFPKSKCLCHSLARRGQPCIMSALTAVQLYKIQSLDEGKLRPSGSIHRVFYF